LATLIDDRPRQGRRLPMLTASAPGAELVPDRAYYFLQKHDDPDF
jgi:hypothetical protein